MFSAWNQVVWPGSQPVVRARVLVSRHLELCLHLRELFVELTIFLLLCRQLVCDFDVVFPQSLHGLPQHVDVLCGLLGVATQQITLGFEKPHLLILGHQESVGIVAAWLHLELGGGLPLPKELFTSSPHLRLQVLDHHRLFLQELRGIQVPAVREARE